MPINYQNKKYTIQDIKNLSRTYDVMQETRTAVVERVNEIQRRIMQECPVRYKIECLNGNIKDEICSIDDELMRKLNSQLDIVSRKCEEARAPVEMFFDFLETIDERLDLELLKHIVLDGCSIMEAARKANVSKSTVIRHCNAINRRFAEMQNNCDFCKNKAS